MYECGASLELWLPLKIIILARNLNAEGQTNMVKVCGNSCFPSGLLALVTHVPVLKT